MASQRSDVRCKMEDVRRRADEGRSQKCGSGKDYPQMTQMSQMGGPEMRTAKAAKSAKVRTGQTADCGEPDRGCMAELRGGGKVARGVPRLTPEMRAWTVRQNLKKPGLNPTLSRVARACRRYQHGLESGAVPARGDGNLAAQVHGLQRAQEKQLMYQEAVKQVLCDFGVLPVMFVPYYNFGRRLARLRAMYLSGETLGRAAADAVSRWAGLGLRPEVLRAIAERVFHVRAKTEANQKSKAKSQDARPAEPGAGPGAS